MTTMTANFLANKKINCLGIWFLFLASCWTSLIAVLAGRDHQISCSFALMTARSAASDSLEKDIRGEISTSAPWASSWGTINNHIPALFIVYGGIWIVGILGLCICRSRLQRHLSNINKIEDALRKSEERHRGLMEVCPDAVVIFDFDGVVVFASPYTRTLLGLPDSEEMLGRNVLDYVVEPDRIRVAASMSELLKVGSRRNMEYTVLHRDGTTVPVDVSSVVIRDSNGQPNAFMVVIRDITQQKRSQEELKQTLAAMEMTNKALDDFSHLTEAATRAKSEFLANMSHEIRTPMTAILGYADMLLVEEGIERAPKHRREAIQTIQRNGEHLLGLINGILDLSRVESGKIQIEPTRCSPVQLVAEVVSLMRVRAEAKQLKFRADLIPPLPETVLTDPLRLRQVLINLVGNAVKFTDHGEVCLAARLISDGGHPRLCFDVTDTGIGIHEEHLADLFQPFSQVDSSSARKFGGTGLGLCISKHLAKALGGDIKVRSQPGKGSTFSLTVDAGLLGGVRMIENTHEALLGRPSTAPARASDKIELHGRRVLLAEDGPDNQRLISHVLRKAGAEVVTVENGQLVNEEALAALACSTPFDVILMDMQMPVMDGYTATRQLRQQEYTGPIIALTAHAMVEDRQKCLDAGCDDYATKPIDRQAFLTLVAYWTMRGRENAVRPCQYPESQVTDR